MREGEVGEGLGVVEDESHDEIGGVVGEGKTGYGSCMKERCTGRSGKTKRRGEVIDSTMVERWG